jgi:hypothetical protein
VARGRSYRILEQGLLGRLAAITVRPFRRLDELVALPFTLCFESAGGFHPGEVMSPVLFLALPLLIIPIASVRSIRPMLVGVAAYLWLWLASGRDKRYLIMALPAFYIALALAMSQYARWLRKGERSLGRMLLTLAGAAALIYPSVSWISEELHSRGPVPTNLQMRDHYLAAELPSYNAYQLVAARGSADNTIYGLYDEQMSYFAPGTFYGDWFGPWRYVKIVRKLRDSRLLYEQLRQWNVRYFLIRIEGLDEQLSPEYAPEQLPSDDFFLSHFRPVYAQRGVLMFELSERPLDAALGSEQIRNGGFEQQGEEGPTDWGSEGDCNLVESAKQSHAGEHAVACRGASYFHQTAEAHENQFYLHRLYAAGEEPEQEVRLQLHWLDEEHRPIGSEQRVMRVGRSWRLCWMVAQAPPRTAYVTVAPVPHGYEAAARFDDVSLVTWNCKGPNP